jgi:hypothetical protein
MFKNKLECKQTANHKIDNNGYSDSEYFELSQKFSTITDPKFFKPELLNKLSDNTHEMEYYNYK